MTDSEGAAVSAGRDEISDEKGCLMPVPERERDAEPPFEITDRGFVHWSPVPSTYGHEVAVYESSAATDPPCMWLAIGKPDEDDECAHLTYEQVTQVAARINAWLHRHREAGARWAADRYATELRRALDLPDAGS